MIFNPENQYFLNGKINEECGVFGLFNVSNASQLTYFGIHALQHRGQEACGIATSDGKSINCKKGKGLITDVFNSDIISELDGNNSIGHVRYSTAGGNEIENVQPLMVRAHTGHFAVCHNGQIVNSKELKIQLENEGSIFQGTSDSEILVHLIQREKGTMVYKIMKACKKLEGAFAFIILTKDCMYAIRDKNGLRPLSVARIKDGYCVSSETCAFNIVNAKFDFDIKPGQVVRFDKDTVKKFQYTEKTQNKMCAMEYIYFARPDSVIENINVHNSRRRAGKILARNDDVEADIVIGVPDSSLSAAMGYAEARGLPNEMGLIKNRYVGRTFIQPTQALREMGVKMKLSAVNEIVIGKKIILIDDSIVRGTTSRRIVKLLKDAGAKEIHVRIASGPIKNPCFYGVDTSSYDELISAVKNEDELQEYIGADSLRFLTIAEMKESIGTNDLCVSCFSGKYPTELFSLGKILEK
jgi:amidophosphoribosyltransferase